MLGELFRRLVQSAALQAAMHDSSFTWECLVHGHQYDFARILVKRRWMIVNIFNEYPDDLTDKDWPSAEPSLIVFRCQQLKHVGSCLNVAKAMTSPESSMWIIRKSILVERSQEPATFSN